MDTSPSDTPTSLTPRRDLLKMAVATGAGFALSALPSAKAADPAPPGTAPKPASSYKYKLNALKPQVDNAGGSVAECDEVVFPVVKNGGAAVFLLKLKPGALREPHWHPNCWEMDYVVAGTVQMTIVPPDGEADIFTLEPGDVAFVPQGFAHSIANIGSDEAIIPIVFNNSRPDDLGLSTMYGKFPAGQFTQTFGVPPSAMSAIPQPKETLIVVPKV